MPEPYYTTEAEVEAILAVSLDTAVAVDLIQDAEDIIDQLLGNWPVDDTTGRKIVEADVETWQWEKLGRATAKLAAKMYTDATISDGANWDEMWGPDFKFKGAIGSTLPAIVLDILNATQLRRLGVIASPGLYMARSRDLRKFYEVD